VALVKDEHPKAKDVMKAAVNIDFLAATYQQSYRAIHRITSEAKVKNERSYQQLIPYMKKFVETNPDSTALVERDHNNNVQRLFVCPGIMQEALRFVRPSMSLDAAAMKCKWKGTLYIASVKTACDEIFPVAIAIADQNENSVGWVWFLQKLRQSLPVLLFDRANYGVHYKYFSFISDRQKG
jgi:hypothetical protein